MLILNDLGVASSPGFSEVDRAISEALQESPYQIELYYESLELTLFPDEPHRRRFRKEFIQKYSNRKPDAIITAGSASLNFIAELHEPFVRDTPIIFCAVLEEIPDRTNAHFTGVLGRLHPEETLNTALRLLPGTKHVAVVGGTGPFDVKWEAIAKQSFQKYESKLEFTYLTDLTMPALLERLKHLPSDTIVYHTALTRDAAGRRFIDSAQSVPLVVGAANAPVFVMDDVDFRAGAVGGNLVNWADDAHVAAEMAVRVLNGEQPQDIPIVTSNNAYVFDWQALQRWGLKESDLPSGSLVLNRQLTFWEEYKRYIISGMLLLLLQTLIIVALLWQRSMRRKTEVELVSLNEALSGWSRRLIEAQEQERTRIARELHDDINQRVALLVLNLGVLKRDLPDAANAARQGIQQAEQQLNELGSDIQTLSHHLHSSKLEYLGLAVAAKGFCREFSERHKVEVHFHSDELPRVLPPEISLCLFRVLQEALQNALKHSGSACFEVSLAKGLNEIQLSVRDSGRGFDVDEAMNGQGVGLVSMKERLKLVDGQLFIDSRVQQGTTIRASVPLSSRMKSAGAVG